MNVFKIFGSGLNKRIPHLNSDEESDLMLRIKNADEIKDAEKEFSTLYDSMVNKLWGKLLKKFNSQLDIDDLQDAFQEGWRKVLENRKSYIEGSNVYNWIYTIIKNTAFDMTRKDKKILRDVEILNKSFVNADKDENEEESIFNLMPSDEKSIEEEIDARETMQIILETIEEIDDEIDRRLIKMRIIENQKFSIIAKEMDIPLATVHYRVNQTLNKLKPKLKKLLEL